MENCVDTQIDEYCRACFLQITKNLNQQKNAIIHKLYPDLVEMFMSCSMTTISENDLFPKQLCDCCYKKLLQFYAFQKMCIISLKRFQNVMQSDEKKELDSNKDNDEQHMPERQKDLAGTNLMKNLRSKGLESRKEKINENKESFDTKHQGNFNDIPQTKEASENDNEKSGTLYKCEICSMRFFVEHRLIAHKRIHDGLIPYPCPRDDCQRGFKRWNCLSEHLKQHEGTNKWFNCTEDGCRRRYKHKTTLGMHMRRYHKKGPELKSFICEICGKVFKSSAILNDHKFTHKDKSELPFACDQLDCKYRFSNREKLKVHLMRHAGIKKFECQFCGMKKTTRNELKIHINYHTLERRFPCRFCTQICNSAGNLKVHVRTVHERAKDYACRFCERTFAKPDTKKYHEMIHTGEKPHQCMDCGKRFIQPAALRTHKKIHLRQQIQTSPFDAEVGANQILETLELNQVDNVLAFPNS